MSAVAVFECVQRIPCNPCVEACPRGAIEALADINDCPKVNEALCNGCGLCLTRCPGLSIVVIDSEYKPDEALLKIPYEFLPLPEAGERVAALGRDGQVLGEAAVVKTQQSQNKTSVIWLAVPKAQMMDIRNICRKEDSHE